MGVWYLPLSPSALASTDHHFNDLQCVQGREQSLYKVSTTAKPSLWFQHISVRSARDEEEIFWLLTLLWRRRASSLMHVVH